jgi:undecaprenyl-diphosphatase
MTIFQSILLGIIQGITEFLPVSSSAHLALTPYLLGWQIPEHEAFLFDVLVQVATLAAVIAYYRRDLTAILSALIRGLLQRKPFAEAEARLGWLIVLGTIPAGLAGIALQDHVEAAFHSPAATAGFLLLTAGLLLAAERLGNRGKGLEALTWQDALWIGFFQAAAIFPGVSRSGATITGGMTRNLQRPAAARFSFLLSIPIMLAAGLLAGGDLAQSPDLGRLLPVFLPGFLASAVTGYLAIRWLIGYLTTHSLKAFSIYCAALALFTLVAGALR